MGLDEQEITRTDDQETSPVKPDKAYNRVLWIVVGVVWTVVFLLALVIVFRARSASNQKMTLTLQPDTVRLAVAEEGVNGNDEWAPYIQQFSGVPMALVPAGCFMMGSEMGADDERPVHQVCFDEPFWIDVYEVTNETYGSLGCEYSSSEPDQPRNCVNWIESQTHCQLRGARLPTEAEWEYAARGPDGLIYPWGNEFVADAVVFDGNGMVSIGGRLDGASWVGALDMIGNALEWTHSIYADYPYLPDDGREVGGNEDDILARVLRGGSWRSDMEEIMRSTTRSKFTPVGKGDIIGFRCARDYEP